MHNNFPPGHPGGRTNLPAHACKRPHRFVAAKSLGAIDWTRGVGGARADGIIGASREAKDREEEQQRKRELFHGGQTEKHSVKQGASGGRPA